MHKYYTTTRKKTKKKNNIFINPKVIKENY